MIKKNCKNCNKEVLKLKAEIARVVNSFCSHSCANTYNNKRIRRNYTDGSGSYRSRALRELGRFCSNKSCPIKKCDIIIEEIMLDVDHKDNNRSHNDLDNLQVLCVWCHRLKTRGKI